MSRKSGLQWGSMMPSCTEKQKKVSCGSRPAPSWWPWPLWTPHPDCSLQIWALHSFHHEARERKEQRMGSNCPIHPLLATWGPLCLRPWVGLPLWRSSWGSASASARSAPGGTGWRRFWVHRACRGTPMHSGLRTQSVWWFGCRSRPRRKGPGGTQPRSLPPSTPTQPGSESISVKWLGMSTQ